MFWQSARRIPVLTATVRGPTEEFQKIRTSSPSPLDTLQPQQLWPGNSWAATWLFGRIRGKNGQKMTRFLPKWAPGGQIWTFFSDFCIFCLIRAKWVQKVGKNGVKENRSHSVLEFQRVSSGLWAPPREKEPQNDPGWPCSG